jgi:superfamily II DNA or RNA helicase
MVTNTPMAPGARIVVRDEEWLVRRVDPSSDGGRLLTCDGVSDLVRGQSSLFLTALEGPIEVLDPAETQLVADPSPMFNAALLYLESQRRRTMPNDARIHLGHRAVMDLEPYQLEPAVQALAQPRSRILIADAVGLGKTLEAGILATELIQRGRGKRILVVTLKSMLTQFQKEWWSRFSIPLVRLDSVGLTRVRHRIPSNHNPFNYFDRSIISIDTLKNNLEYRNYLENAWWDIIVIDECHNVAARAAEQGKSRRARLAEKLAGRSDTLILLSATPHDGSARSFASLMALLDPTAISDPDDYTPKDYRHKGLVIRRFKKDIRHQVTGDFKERRTIKLTPQASAEEEAAYRALLAVRFTQSGTHRGGKQQELQRVAMQKAIFSCPFAALESTHTRIQRLTRACQPTTDERQEVADLQAFAAVLGCIDANNFSKYQRLLAYLTSAESGWSLSDPADRVVVFSERLETLRWLHGQLQRDLRLHDQQITLMHGQLPDTAQQEIVERFGRREDPLRLLLCSDVASEGLNLHYFCHRLIHFDLPWSLMVFQQRNGRVDRYGQAQEPQILYLFTATQVETIRGDLRILEILQQKDEQATLNLGDPAAFLNVYDPDREVEKVSDFMASGMTPAQVSATLDAQQANAQANEGDWLLQLFGGGTAAAPVEKPLVPQGCDHIEETPGLFKGEYHFTTAALAQLAPARDWLQWTPNEAAQGLAITAPPDLQERLQQLPREVRSSDNRYELCADPARLKQAIEQARQAKAEDETWPQLHYLWPQHPIVDWLVDRVITRFGRHGAPVIQSHSLQPGEQAFVMMGLVPNRKGQPLLVDWQVTCRQPGQPFTLEPYEAFVQRAGLQAGRLPNPGSKSSLQDLQAALPEAVARMRQHMVQRQAAFADEMQQRLQGTLADLERLQDEQMQQLELRLEKQLEQVRRSRFERRSQSIRRVFDEYRQWVEDTLSTEPEPYLQVLAAVCG